MKKFLATMLCLTFIFCFSLQFGATAFAQASESGVGDSSVEIAEGWLVPEGYEGRVSIKKTDKGIVIEQLVQGTPSSHAVALAMPVSGTKSYEVTLSIEMEEYVASGRQANDVWTGIGFMGKPEFIHWQNNEANGYAKDSPGIFTRFFNYSGEYRLISDVYQEKFNNGTDIVDTWTLLNTAAGASVSKDITIKLSYDTQETGSWYNLSVNGKVLTGGAEFLNVEPDKVFPDNQIYLEIAMNTQKKDTNANTKVIIKSINGQSFVTDKAVDDKNEDNNLQRRGGCSSSLNNSGVIILAGVGVALAFCLVKRNEKNN